MISERALWLWYENNLRVRKGEEGLEGRGESDKSGRRENITNKQK